MAFHVERHTSKLERTPRAARACIACHVRKVRCDLTPSTAQCTNCVRDGQHCKPRIRQRRSNIINRRPVSAHVPVDTEGVPSGSEDMVVIASNSEAPARLQLPQNSELQSTEFPGKATERSDVPSSGSVSAPAASITSAGHGSGHMERLAYLAPENFAAEDSRAIHYTMESPSEISSKIIEAQQALELPPRAVRESLCESFFAYCYAWDPTVERAEVFGSPLEGISPLLLQAVLLAGSRASTGLTSIATPEQYYTRAKTLFYLNHEQDPLTLLKAVSLLHWYNPHGPERVSTDTATFWCRIAVNLAQQMGLHRQQKRVQDEPLRRRIWWSLVARDFLISLAHGRPPAINLDDCDVPRLTLNDFPQPTVVGLVFIAFVDLSLVLGRFTTNMLRRVPPKVHDAEVENALYRWIKTLPEPIRLSPRIQFLKPYDFECRQIHVMFYVSLVLLHRPRTVTVPFSTAAVLAASTVAGIFEEFLARDKVRFLGPMFTFHLLAAAIALLPCYKYHDLWTYALKDIETIRQAQVEMALKWPSALGSIKSFEKMYEVTINTADRRSGPPETKLMRDQAIYFEDVDISLCRMWEILQKMDVISSDIGSWNTADASSAPSLVIHRFSSDTELRLGEREVSSRQFTQNASQDNDTHMEENTIGDWLFWGQD